MIFGYWGIDLNTEEIFISFVFLVLVMVLFLSFRRSIAILFVKSVNLIYNRFLLDILLRVELLEAYLLCLAELILFFEKLERLLFFVEAFRVQSRRYVYELNRFVSYKSYKLFLVFNFSIYLFSNRILFDKYFFFRGSSVQFFRNAFRVKLK
jgi:hypothetical protein